MADARERDTRTPVPQATLMRLFDECMKAKGFPGAPDGTGPNEFWSTERLNEVGAERAGDEAMMACFKENSHLKPQ